MGKFARVQSLTDSENSFIEPKSPWLFLRMLELLVSWEVYKGFDLYPASLAQP